MVLSYKRAGRAWGRAIPVDVGGVRGVGDLECCHGLALEFDGNGADLFLTVDTEKHTTGDLVKIRVELGLVIESDAHSHGWSSSHLYDEKERRRLGAGSTESSG